MIHRGVHTVERRAQADRHEQQHDRGVAPKPGLRPGGDQALAIGLGEGDTVVANTGCHRADEGGQYRGGGEARRTHPQQVKLTVLRVATRQVGDQRQRRHDGGDGAERALGQHQVAAPVF